MKQIVIVLTISISALVLIMAFMIICIIRDLRMEDRKLKEYQKLQSLLINNDNDTI